MIKRHTSTDKQFYFTLCGKNGKVILTSETYKTKRNMERGITAAKGAFYRVRPTPLFI